MCSKAQNTATMIDAFISGQGTDQSISPAERELWNTVNNQFRFALIAQSIVNPRDVKPRFIAH